VIKAAILVREAPVKLLNIWAFFSHLDSPRQDGHFIARFVLIVYRGYMRGAVLAGFHASWPVLKIAVAGFAVGHAGPRPSALTQNHRFATRTHGRPNELSRYE